MYHKQPSMGMLIEKGHPMVRGLVGAWIAGPGKLTFDYSGNGNHGTLTGSTIGLTTAKYGRAWQITGDGVSDQIDFGSIVGNNILNCADTQEISIIARLYKPDDADVNNSFPRIIDKSDDGGATKGYCLFWRLDDNKFDFRAGDVSMRSAAISDFDSERVATIGVSAKTGDVNFYYNGVLIGTDASAFTIPSDAADLAIGNWNHTIDRQWNGWIEYVYVWNRVLTQDEVRGVGNSPYEWFYTSSPRMSFGATAMERRQWNMQLNNQSTLEFTQLSIPDGSEVTIDWGDGNSDKVTGPQVNTLYDHTYAGVGNYQVTFSGNVDAMTRVYVKKSEDIAGNIADFPSNLEYARFESTSVSGDVANLPSSLTYARFNVTSVSGDTADLPSGLTYARFGSTALTGDIADLPSGLAYTSFPITSVSGELADLPSSLTDGLFYNNLDAYTYDGSDLAFKDNNNLDLDFDDCNFSETEIDQIIIDLAAGTGSDGSLDLGGTNATRTAASDAAKATLIGRSWSITVNE